jgi:tRNA threonylcarbamoyladenosine biosynthesis protein TsaB
MIVLSFDTSTAACSAAVIDVGADTRLLSSSYCEPGRGHAEILLDTIEEVMSTAGVGFEDIDRQVVTIGPGSFTGVRVALSAARGFRLTHNIPICSLSTMQAIAANISKFEAARSSSAIAVIMDARRHQVFGQVFDADLKPLSAPALIDVDGLERWLEPWKDMPLSLLGTGAGLVKAENWTVIDRPALPDAACFGRVLADIAPDDSPPDPLYLRQPDAKPQLIGLQRA